jgi:hypothetical protein
MPKKKTIERARRDKREGKAVTMAGGGLRVLSQNVVRMLGIAPAQHAMHT